MTDPFHIKGPAIINVSGGRTSALMLRRILDAHGGRLPDDVHAVFANTGKERPETLTFLHRCAQEWGVHIVWIERDPDAGAKFREVDYDTAARNAEPFDRLIIDKSFLPNAVMRFCTQELKIVPAKRYMQSLGYDAWVSVVGLRADEPSRVSKIRARDHGRFVVDCPLARGGVTREMVDAFWRAQSFDLGLRPWESNCAGCYIRSAKVLERIERDTPGILDWWVAWEKRMGATFYNSKPFAPIQAKARLPMLPLDLDGDALEAPGIPCNCTD